MARLLMAAEAVVEELDRQGLLEAVINLGFDPDQMAMAVIKAADRDVVPPKCLSEEFLNHMNHL